MWVRFKYILHMEEWIMKSAVFWIVATSVNLILEIREHFFVPNKSDWVGLIFAIVCVICSIYWYYKDKKKMELDS